MYNKDPADTCIGKCNERLEVVSGLYRTVCKHQYGMS